MALLLRHDPAAGGIHLDQNGWTDLDGLVAALNRTFGVTASDVTGIVESDPKRRYAIDGRRIRANQGHSVSVDLNLQPKRPPDVLYHGTVERFLQSILAQGLDRRQRTHVHLSPDVPTALVVARRRKGSSPVVLQVDAGAMHRAGLAFFEAENGVWLVDAVPTAFLSILNDASALA